MPRLACFTCGRSFWATAPVAQLLREERRCPRCGAQLNDDRRVSDRRMRDRRMMNAGPPPEGDQRVSDRRHGARRRKPA